MLEQLLCFAVYVGALRHARVDISRRTAAAHKKEFLLYKTDNPNDLTVW